MTALSSSTNELMSSSSAADTPERWPPTTCASVPTSISHWSARARCPSGASGFIKLVADSGTATVDYGTLLGDGIRLVVDSLPNASTPLDGRCVLTSGAALDYDYLIYAVGSTGEIAAVPGAAEFAYSIADLDNCATAAPCPGRPATGRSSAIYGGGRRLDRHRNGCRTGTGRDVPGGPGVRVAWCRLTIVEQTAGRRSVGKQLRRLGVDVLESVAVSEVRWDAVVLHDGPTLPRSAADGVDRRVSGCRIWPHRSGFRTDALGRVLTDETQRPASTTWSASVAAA